MAVGDDGPGAGDLDHAIAVLRARVDEEFRISERLDSKGRQLFALAAGVFAVTQTVVFGSFSENRVGTDERVALCVMALLAGLALWWTAHAQADGEDLAEEGDTRPEAIVEWVNAATTDRQVTLQILGELARVARERDTSNRARAVRYDLVQTRARWVLILTATELIFGILFRI